jgi:hypothetical protein
MIINDMNNIQIKSREINYRNNEKSMRTLLLNNDSILSTDPENMSTDPENMSTGPEDMSTDPEDMSTDPEDMFTDPEDMSKSSAGPKSFSFTLAEELNH